jgi:hypothetical protein
LDVSYDARVLAFTFGLSVITAIMFGLLPALRATTTHAWVDSGPVALSSSSVRLRSVLVVAQVALSVVLLTGAGLFLRTLVNLKAVSGFNADSLCCSRRTHLAGYEGERLAGFYQQLADSAGRIPGVRTVGFSSLPLLAADTRAAASRSLDAQSDLA